MANELMFSYQAGKTTYVLIRNRISQVWSTSGGTGGFENYATARYADYVIEAVQQGVASAFYAATMPAAVPAGIYSITAKEQVGGSEAETDPTVAVGDEQWNGTVTLPLSDLATSGQLSLAGPVKIQRGTMVAPFNFNLVSNVDHITAFTSGVVSGQIQRDAGAWGPLQSGAFTEIGLGLYSLQALTSGDLNANFVSLQFSAVGVSGGAADNRNFGFILQRSSGN